MRQQSSATLTMAYPALPASPTLTNPDMILPHYGEYESTPSPPQNPMRPLSLPGGWKGPEPDDFTFSIGPPGHLPMGVGPMTPTTPIIYGNGTLLSDIGEVTEAESTPGRKPRQFQMQQATGDDSPVRSSPTMGYNATKKRTKRPPIHQRSVSAGSSSTATTEGLAVEAFGDFDDGVSMDDSNFQGDDEESVADESDEHRVAVAQTKGVVRKEPRAEDDEDLNSSVALSRRAELILANAKRRLDNMEGNLTRARSSLYITPSSSMSSMHSGSPLSGSTPSPSDAEHRILPQLGIPPAKHRQPDNPSSGALGHTRVSSENSIPSSYNPLQSPRSLSFSILSTRSGEADSKVAVRSAHTIPLNRSSNTYSKPLEPLSEDDTYQSRERDGNVRSSTAESYFMDPFMGIPEEHRFLARSSSSMQMRDLTDKMKDLKGKISSLRDRAREDTMKRRSLQSLRAPSPFTVADQWYTVAKASKDGRPAADVNVLQNVWDVENKEASSGKSDENTDGNLTEKAADDADLDVLSDFKKTEDTEEALTGHVNWTTPPEQEDVYETADEEEADAEVELEDEVDGVEDDYDDELVDHDELDEYQSEGDASLYHDTSSVPLSHEDREDAFDYEHFFLHSAMGTLTEAKLKRRGSDDSFSSEGSVETTRGPEAPIHPQETPGGNSLEQVRSHRSTDSVSTLASFATATEGFYPISAESEGNVHDHIVRNTSPQRDQPAADSTLGKRSPRGLATNAEQASGKSTPETVSRPNSVIRVGSRQQSHMDRPSISSFSSAGTTRSFPLVNKPKTPSFSPVSSMPITANGALNNLAGDNMVQSSPVSMLDREDQILIEQIVASLGKCVLGLQESARANTEALLWRRRLELATRVLEGEECPACTQNIASI